MTIKVLDQTITTNYALYNGDSAEAMEVIPDNSVDLSCFSPPFIDLFVYNDSPRDIGNSRGPLEFWRHMRWVIDGLLRVTKPGRNACVHVMQVPAMKVRDGYIGLKDFRGMTIRAFERRGWIYYGEFCIPKNPQAQAIARHSHGLSFSQLERDSSDSRQALADFVLVFQKPGDNAVPIRSDITRDDWIDWADYVWENVRVTYTLNVRQARSDKDSKHICPMPLEAVERIVRLWSNPGEVVFDPFAGIGSTGYEAIRHGRRFMGIELNPHYYKTAISNLDVAVGMKQQLSLFDITTGEAA